MSGIPPAHRAVQGSGIRGTVLRRSAIRLGFGALFATVLGVVCAQDPPREVPSPGQISEHETPTLSWHRALAPAIEEARKRQVPILVRVGAEWCGWCRKLDKEIAQPTVQRALSNWVLVELDADADADEVRRMNIGPIPALRVLNTGGRTTKSHDGFLTADDLIVWLRSRDEAADPDLSEEVTEVDELSEQTLPKLVRLLGHRDAHVRVAVSRQLSGNRGLAGAAVAQALIRGNLSTRLSALEIMTEWKAPTLEIDPWQPQTLTAARLKTLEEWADTLDPLAVPSAPEVIEALTPEQWAEARSDITKLLKADPSEVEAIGTQLARYGTALLPEVREQGQAATTDVARERLDGLRYRLVASDALALKWPGGLARLAATDAQVRRLAASELPTVASSGEETLLIELFRHPDPLVRELSLKALQVVGGPRANTELVRLLTDPDANVRAAVLNQLAENPGSISVKQIADYIAAEQDQDLIVHAIRLLREMKRKDAVECLSSLFNHATWQVRAEAVEAVGALVSDQEDRFESSAPRDANRITTEVIAEAYVEILDKLSDSDGFVVSRAVLALRSADLPIAAQPLAKSAEQHPELAKSVADTLTNKSKIRAESTPLLTAWLTHNDAALRSAALRALGKYSELDGASHIIPALSDTNESVRIAAVDQLLWICEQSRPTPDHASTVLSAPEPVPESLVGQALLALGGLVPQAPQKNPEPDSSARSAELHPQEAWLVAFRVGMDRPKWMNLAKEPLQAMLKSTSPEERLAGGTALIAMGDDELAPRELARIASENGHLVTAVAKSLHWLPWERRAELFTQLRTQATDSHMRATLCEELVVLRDTRASALLWAELEGEQITADFALAVSGNLRSIHRMQPSHHYRSEDPLTPVGFQTEVVTQFATSPHVWQQRVALALLLLAEESVASDVAKAIVADEQATPDSRSDAFRIVLLTSSPTDSNALAVAAILDLDSPLRRPALAYLTLGEAGVKSFGPGEFELERQGVSRYDSANDRKGELPKDLTVEHLKPFLTSPDDETVAQAAYLLAMLGQAEGLDQLIAVWRKAKSSDNGQQWENLLVEAIAASDNSRDVPLLEEIYRVMLKDRADDIPNLYWTIRSMHGPEILKLRKRIRDEVGMDGLR